MMKYDAVIIDPASTEFNRGSFCYLPYILYSVFMKKGLKVKLLEDFTCANIDEIPEAKNYFVALWSYPQIEACLVLERFMEKRPLFFGYGPLIEKYFGRQNYYELSNQDIEKGIEFYWEYFDDFKFLLLSDCDMHLKKYSGQVYPMFTSYGCNNLCSFCPVGVNCQRQRIIVDENSVIRNLKTLREKGKMNFHFTDEDFFFDIDRAYNILKGSNSDGKMKFISLGHVNSVVSFIKKYGSLVLEETGMKLIEVGFETGSIELSKMMHKPTISKYLELKKLCNNHVDIFWLTLTFFPGETIRTLNDTGSFLKENGFQLEEVYGRIATNSTHGGLGQFFQLYDGVKEYQSLISSGHFLTDRPMRLIPSFIPFSFLRSKINFVRPIDEEERKWYLLYGIVEEDFVDVHVGDTVWECLKLNDYQDLVKNVKKLLYVAISARLGVLK